MSGPPNRGAMGGDLMPFWLVFVLFLGVMFIGIGVAASAIWLARAVAPAAPRVECIEVEIPPLHSPVNLSNNSASRPAERQG